MKRKIIIAGAGHGGVVAASILAKNGFDVTVYEKKKKEDMGFDWHDTFRITCFDDAGIPAPPENSYKRSFPLAFTNPEKTVRISLPDSNNGTNCSMDRKYLISYLINHAKNNGVKFVFDTEITGIIADTNRILGIVTVNNNRKSTIFSDLLIDSAGIDSPVKKLIPKKFMTDNELPDNCIFTTYRAYYERISPDNPEVPYTVYLFHMKKPGISWVIAHQNHFDILIGHFGTELSGEDIELAVKDLKHDNPAIGDNIIRGGSVEKIPLCKTSSVIVANGYAAVGDSAAMTIPIMGSGIANSIRAGKILADAVLADTNSIFTAETLWQYQYEYFSKIGNNLVIADKLRELSTEISADDIDYIFEKELLSQKDIDLGTDGNFNMLYILQKIIKALPKLPKLTNAAKILSKYNTIKTILDTIPKKYDEEKIKQWAKKYKEL